MPRCTEKTTKGLRCKGNGVENNGVIMCATHLKYFEHIPPLISVTETVVAPIPPACTHKDTCDLTHEKCCECSDTRPIQEEGYVAYINTYLIDGVSVPRHYYYCPSCKERVPQDKFDTTIAEMKKIVDDKYNADARWYIDGLAKTHNAIVKDVKNTLVDPINTHEQWNFCVNDTLDHILSTRLAGMPEDRSLWTGNDAKINALINSLTEIHESMLTQKQKSVNPDRPETLEAAYERIDELQNKIAEMEPQVAAAKENAKEAALMSLWNSGCEDMCYHLGFCSDVMGDCWEPVYEKDGLEALKANLREVSKLRHCGKECKDCTRWIDSLHD